MKKILIVEDDHSIQESLEKLLQTVGFEVSTAFNGQEAQAFLKMNEAPDLILLDLMMPVKDGYTFRSEQLEDAKIAKIPVIVMSAINHLAPTQKLLKVEKILKKPFDLDEVLSAVGHYFPTEEMARFN